MTGAKLRGKASRPGRRFAVAQLPAFIDNSRPTPESAGRKLFIHAATIATLLASSVYLGWRIVDTVNLAVWWVSVPLVAAEVHNTFGLLLFTLALWDIDVSPPWRPVDRTGLRVAVLVTTYNEPEEVLIPTIAATVALEPAHETWVLDDGHRPAIQRLAREMGARYLSRPDNAHAKAGNLNHALGIIEADVIAVLDADHVAGPNFLRHTLCYFDDPRVAIVQTPQDFYNLDSFEHERRGDRQFNEEAVFYRVIGPGKNKWDAAFWCGTSALVRTKALAEVGGVATESVTEDIHTTIRMNRRGWRGVYHNEVLARGLAPADAIQYMIQRNRWAIGAMQVLRSENPVFGRGLTFGQRLGFATTLFAWFDSWRTLLFLALPVAVLFTGASPIDAPGYLYGPLFLSAFSAQFFALRVLARGYYPPILSLVFEMLRMPAVLPATLAIFFPSRFRSFRVTPKGRQAGRRHTPVPLLLSVPAVASALAILWFAATIAGLTFTSYDEKPAVIGSAVFAAANFFLVLKAIARIRDARFASERRASVRFDVLLEGTIAGAACSIHDISLTGARVESSQAVAERPTAAPVTLAIALERETVRLKCEPIRPALNGHVFGVRFARGQRRAIGQLALALLNSEAAYAPPAEAAPSSAAGSLLHAA